MGASTCRKPYTPSSSAPAGSRRSELCDGGLCQHGYLGFFLVDRERGTRLLLRENADGEGARSLADPDEWAGVGVQLIEGFVANPAHRLDLDRRNRRAARDLELLWCDDDRDDAAARVRELRVGRPRAHQRVRLIGPLAGLTRDLEGRARIGGAEKGARVALTLFV